MSDFFLVAPETIFQLLRLKGYENLLFVFSLFGFEKKNNSSSPKKSHQLCMFNEYV